MFIDTQGMWRGKEYIALMRRYYLIDSFVAAKIHSDKEFGVAQAEMGKKPRVVFDLFKLFWVHKYHKLCLCIHCAYISAHAGTLWSVAAVALLSVAVICFHKANYTTIRA